jgi:hypothetical protein
MEEGDCKTRIFTDNLFGVHTIIGLVSITFSYHFQLWLTLTKQEIIKLISEPKRKLFLQKQLHFFPVAMALAFIFYIAP